MMFAKVIFTVDGGLYNDFLNFLLDENFKLFDITHTQLGFSATCYRDEYIEIARKAPRFQCRTKIKNKKGVYFKTKKLLKRKGIFVGCCLFLILAYSFSHLIWDINIKTDNLQLKNDIATRLYQQGIYAGAFYTEEKLDNAKEHILLISDDLGYLTLNFYKGILTAEVYPRTDRADYLSAKSPMDIYAAQSGIITDLRVYQGFSQVELGQSVSQGDILVSHITTDKHGNFYSSETRAYIEALCDKTYSVFIPFNKSAQVLTGYNDSTVTVCFLGGDYIFSRADTDNWRGYLEKTEMEYFSFIGFHLPFTVTTTTCYQLDEIVIENDTISARNLAKLQIEHFINNDDKLKEEINRSYDYIIKTDGLQLNCIVTGHYEIT